ncbi:hypothetical protein BY458DRAFT_502557 [Sporodiniella umbellata]|nr:hypothetical protein BY458DRAFT_502557 [Sporodiniella umbellata]
MKFAFIASCVFAAASQAMAAINVSSPWGQVTWTAGQTGEIAWTATAPEDTMNCDIQLLNGDYTHSNLVALITATETPIPCSVGKFNIYPLNDFSAGQYWIRIGQSSTNNWYYSGLFTYNGNGTVGPVSTAWTPATSTATAVEAPNASASPSTMEPGAIVAKAVAATSGSSTNKISALFTLTAIAVASMTI